MLPPSIKGWISRSFSRGSPEEDHVHAYVTRIAEAAYRAGRDAK